MVRVSLLSAFLQLTACISKHRRWLGSTGANRASGFERSMSSHPTVFCLQPSSYRDQLQVFITERETSFPNSQLWNSFIKLVLQK